MGRWLAARGITLVFGGGSIGLMGVLADACLAGGGRVIGVIPRFLLEREMGHPGVSQLEVVETMHQRKARMAELSDAFVALPGGLGTLEELFELWTARLLGLHSKPLGLLDPTGFFGGLEAFLHETAAAGFVDREALASLVRAHRSPELIERLEQARAAIESGPALERF